MVGSISITMVISLVVTACMGEYNSAKYTNLTRANSIKSEDAKLWVYCQEAMVAGLQVVNVGKHLLVSAFRCFFTGFCSTLLANKSGIINIVIPDCKLANDKIV